jgi:adenylate cyclase
MELFQSALVLKEDDGPSRTYVERCRLFREHPPGPDWDCAFCLEK